MTEILVTIAIVGLIAGFVFSMPIAGPISILVTSNALKGNFRKCMLITTGASFADFIYVFIAVYGLTRLYTVYKPIIPYLMGAGGLFIILIGYKIFKTKIDLDHIDDKFNISDKFKKRGNGGFYTGVFVNLFNPTLFFGWFSTSFIVISIVSSLGFNTGGLDTILNRNISELNTIENNVIEKPKMPSYLQFDTLHILKKEFPKQIVKPLPARFNLIIGLCFAFFLSLGSILWYYFLSFIIIRYRARINIRILNTIIKSMGIILCLFGVYFCYKAITMII
jgi:threonine/homoserine/homoserine lactone efflux protein